MRRTRTATKSVAGIAALALTACNPLTAELPPDIQAQLHSALAYVCPFVPILKEQIPNANTNAHTALLVAELSCPPNSPPTTLAGALAMIATVAALRPLINRDIARGIVPAGYAK